MPAYGTVAYGSTGAAPEPPPPTLSWDDEVASLSPTVWWKLDELSGTTAADSSGNDHPGVYYPGSTGTWTLGEPSLIGSTSETCAAVTSNGYVEGEVDALDWAPISWVAVMKSAEGPGTSRALGGWAMATTPWMMAIGMLVGPTGLVGVGMDDEDNTWHPIASETNVMDGEAHLVGFTYDGTNLTGYVDGESFGTIAVTGHSAYGPLYIEGAFGTAGLAGALGGGYLRYNGKLQSLMVWASCLTAGDMAALQASRFLAAPIVGRGKTGSVGRGVLTAPHTLPVAGAVAWWDATQLTGLTDGEGVSSWPDASGVSGPLLAPGTEPVYKVNIKNGHPIVRFNGTGGLRAADVAMDDFTVFMVVNPVPGTGMIYEHSDNWNTNPGSGIYWAGNSFTMVHRYSLYSDCGAVPSGLPATFLLLEHRYAAGQSLGGWVYVNETLVQQGSQALPSEPGLTEPFNVGCRAGSSLFATMDVGEIIIYPSLLSSGDIASVEAYLRAKWFGVALHGRGSTRSIGVGAFALGPTTALHGHGSTGSVGAGHLWRPVALSGEGETGSAGLGSLSPTRPLALGTTGSEGGGTLSLGEGLAGSGSTGSSGVAALSDADVLVGSASSSSIGVAALTIGRPLSGSAETASEGVGHLTSTEELTGVSTTGSVGLGIITLPLVGRAASSSSGSGQLSVAIPLTSSSATASSGAATLSLGLPLPALGLTGSVGVGALVATTPLTSVSATVSSGSATLSLGLHLAGQGSTASAGAALLSLGISLTGSAESSSAGSASLSLPIALTAAGASSSIGRGSLSLAIPLVGRGFSSSLGSAELLDADVLVGTAATGSLGVGTLQALVPLAGAGVTSSSGSAGLTVADAFVGSGSTGSIGLGQRLIIEWLTGAGASASRGLGSLALYVIERPGSSGLETHVVSGVGLAPALVADVGLETATVASVGGMVVP
jgi:hypothetical protein